VPEVAARPRRSSPEASEGETVRGTLCVYALASRQAGRISVRGVLGEPLQAVRIGRLDAIVGRVRAIPGPTDSNLRRYGRVMSWLWRRTPALLPARFGTSARDLADLQAMVRGRERVMRGRLRAVRNRAQMTVRLVTQEKDAGRALSGTKQTGTQYLRARQRAYAVPSFAPLRAAVRRWIRDERVEKRGSVASIYHLVPRGSAARYESAIEEAAWKAGVRMIVSGPWPPYAFADIW
jgi:hypothetical protein